MSSQAASGGNTAPWRATFLEHVNNKMASPEFVLSTLHSAPAGSPTPYVPRARFCIFRGMWTNLPDNKHNDAPVNPQIYESDMPTFTTDVRMQKVLEVFETSKGEPHADGKSLHEGTGGGGPVEAVWWVKDANVQWRVGGLCYFVGPDVEGDGNESSGSRTVKSEVGKGMRLVGDEEKKTEWSWEREVTGHFGNCSPKMRGTFKNPPPGLEKGKPYDDTKESLGQKVTSLDDAVAREHFRVAIIKPLEVEMLDLDPENPHRDRYSYDASADSWSKTTTWP